jgi:hypothetical protein
MKRAMDLSEPGLLGAMLGALVGVANYLVFLRVVVPSLERSDKSQTREERDEFARKMSLLRRIILGFDVVVFTALGYYAGKILAG